MGKSRILIVDDDRDISNALRNIFLEGNYEVDTVLSGSEALEKTRLNQPHLILMETNLPDIDGFDVCRVLRTQTLTSQVPIFFLTQKLDRLSRLQGLEAGADDYITKPFDKEELNLRVRRAINRFGQQNLNDPRSGLPSGRLIEEQLRRIIRMDSWAFLDLKLENFQAFEDVYGFVAADNLLRFTAMLFRDVVDELGDLNDFIGHAGGDQFVIITTEAAAPKITERVKKRFKEEVLAHYSFIDRERGFLAVEAADGLLVQAALMTLAVGLVSPTLNHFADIREITELAAENRRQNGRLASW